jgi:hypothetical protein
MLLRFKKTGSSSAEVQTKCLYSADRALGSVVLGNLTALAKARLAPLPTHPPGVGKLSMHFYLVAVP